MSSMLLLKVIFLLFDQVLVILGLLLSHLGYGFLPTSDVRAPGFFWDVWDSMGGFRSWSCVSSPLEGGLSWFFGMMALFRAMY